MRKKKTASTLSSSNGSRSRSIITNTSSSSSSNSSNSSGWTLLSCAKSSKLQRKSCRLMKTTGVDLVSQHPRSKSKKAFLCKLIENTHWLCWLLAHRQPTSLLMRHKSTKSKWACKQLASSRFHLKLQSFIVCNKNLTNLATEPVSSNTKVLARCFLAPEALINIFCNSFPSASINNILCCYIQLFR